MRKKRMLMVVALLAGCGQKQPASQLASITDMEHDLNYYLLENDHILRGTCKKDLPQNRKNCLDWMERSDIAKAPLNAIKATVDTELSVRLKQTREARTDVIAEAREKDPAIIGLRKSIADNEMALQMATTNLGLARTEVAGFDARLAEKDDIIAQYQKILDEIAKKLEREPANQELIRLKAKTEEEQKVQSAQRTAIFNERQPIVERRDALEQEIKDLKATLKTLGETLVASIDSFYPLEGNEYFSTVKILEAKISRLEALNGPVGEKVYEYVADVGIPYRTDILSDQQRDFFRSFFVPAFERHTEQRLGRTLVVGRNLERLVSYLRHTTSRGVDVVEGEINHSSLEASLTSASTLVIADADAGDVTPETKKLLKSFVEGGGRVVALAGTKTLNDVFDWKLEQSSDPERSYKNNGCEEFSGIESVESTMTTKHILMRSAPDSAVAAFTCKVRCNTYGAVVRFDMGRGNAYYLGWDYKHSLSVDGSNWGKVMTRIVTQYRK